MKKYQMMHSVKRKRLAMLDLLIASQQGGQIDEQVDSFMLEGHGKRQQWAFVSILLLLSEHEDVQARARAGAPNKFDSDRFLPERRQQRHSLSYIPFRAGSRNCFGYKFATMELKAVIAHLSQNFYLDCTCSEKRLIQEIQINYTLDLLV